MTTPKNQFLSFAAALNALVQAQDAYAAAGTTQKGFQNGQLPPQNLNKPLRQATFIAAALAQFVANTTGQDVLDNGDLAGFVTRLTTALNNGGGGNILQQLASPSGASLIGVSTPPLTVQAILDQLTVLANGAEQVSRKGQPNGYAPLNAQGTVPAQYITITGTLHFVGVWAANTGQPPSNAPNADDYWVVNVAGNTNLGGINTWGVGDQAVYAGAGVWQRIPNAQPPASGIANDSNVNGATVAAALNTLLAAVTGLLAPAWAGSNTEIGVADDTTPETVIDSRNIGAGALLPNDVIEGEACFTVPQASVHAPKHIRLCVGGDTAHSLLYTLAAGQWGTVVVNFTLMVRTGTQGSSISTARLNTDIIGLANGAVAWNFGTSATTLQARAWPEDVRDVIDVEYVNWKKR